MSTQRFAVEFDRRVVGVAVRVPGGFMFYASGDDFAELNGRLFRRARGIERQLRRIADRPRRPQAQPFHARGLVPAMALSLRGAVQ